MVGLLTVDAGPVEMSIYEVVSEIPNIVWFMVVAPYQLFCFYVAEQRNTVLGSVGQAWRALRSSWGPLALLAVGIQLLFAPSGVILAYVTAWSDTVPANQIDGLALGFGLLFVAWVGLLVGAATTEFILAAAYRQIHPAAPEEPV